MYKTSLGKTSERAMAPHSSTLAWKIPWTEEPGRLQSMGSLRVRYDWATSLSLFTFMHWRRKWQPTPAFLPGESQGRGAWWAAVYGIAQSRIRLKRLSSSSSRHNIPMIIWHSLCSLEVRRFTYIEEDKRVKEKVLIEKKRGSWDGHKYWVQVAGGTDQLQVCKTDHWCWHF